MASPIGLGQGAFQIYTDRQGVERAVNAFGNQGLFNRIDVNAPKYSTMPPSEKNLMSVSKGSVELSNLVNLLQKLAR